MIPMETATELLTVPQLARALGITSGEAFDLVFVSRAMPAGRHPDGGAGVTVAAVDEYRRSHASR